jgi:transposase
MKTYSLDLRERVVRASDRGDESQRQIAERFGVSTAWIRSLLKRRRETGSIEAHRRGGCRPPKIAGRALVRLKRELEKQPDATLGELRDRVGVPASIMAVSRALDRLGVRRKKRRSTPPNRHDQTSR